MNDELLKQMKQIAAHLENLVFEVSRCTKALDVLIKQNGGVGEGAARHGGARHGEAGFF